jgi:hypothetical protein
MMWAPAMQSAEAYFVRVASVDFFIASGLTDVPAVLLFAALDYWHRRKQPVTAMGVQSNS